MTTRSVLGIDPGPTTGMCLLSWVDGKDTFADVNVVQCDDRIASVVADALMRHGDAWNMHVAIEKFVIGRGSMRAGRHGVNTVQLVARLHGVAVFRRVKTVHEQTAGLVKPWATDDRLDAADLLPACKGMRHARDAARHALFAAVKHCGFPDPFLTKGRGR